MILSLKNNKAFVVIPKCACTYLKGVYLNLIEDNLRLSYGKRYYNVQEKIRKKIYFGINSDDVDDIYVYSNVNNKDIKNFQFYWFVRNPLDRCVSSFLNKLVTNITEINNLFIADKYLSVKDIEKNKRRKKVLGEFLSFFKIKSINDIKDITFEDFINFLYEEIIVNKNKKIDGHFKPMYMYAEDRGAILPLNTNYNKVIHIENVYNSKYLKKIIKYFNKKKINQTKKNKIYNEDFSKMCVSNLINNVPKNYDAFYAHNKNVMRKVKTIYQNDFTYFNYDILK